MAILFSALTSVPLRIVSVVFLVVLGTALAQKRARPAVADLEMLISDPAYGNSEVSGLSGRGGGYDNLVNLAETLKKLQEMEKFYSHQARPRYGRSVNQQESPAGQLDFPSDSQTLRKTDATSLRANSVRARRSLR